MRIGWLQDDPGYIGGGELNANAFKAAVPDGVTIVECPRENVIAGLDRYIVQNCAGYGPDTIDILAQAPTVKMLHDVWPHGSDALRDWLLTFCEKVIMVSPKVAEWLPYPVRAPVHYVPSCIDVSRFEQAIGQQATNGKTRKAAVYLGQYHVNKGVIEAAEWAYHQGIRLDAYGWGDMSQVVEPIDHKGRLDYADVPATLAQYETLVFLPMFYDACPRVIFEGWAAGCQVVTNGMQGASWWIENDSEAIEDSATRFWKVVLGE